MDLTHDAQFPFDFTGEPVSADAQLQQQLLEPELEQFERRYPEDGRVGMEVDRPDEPSPEPHQPMGVWAPHSGVEEPPAGEAATIRPGEKEQDATTTAIERMMEEHHPGSTDPRNEISANEESAAERRRKLTSVQLLRRGSTRTLLNGR